MEAFEPVQKAKLPSLFLLPEWMSLDSRLTAGFTGRDGGISEAPFASFNMGLHVGDEDADVIANRQRLTEALGWPFEAWTCTEQVHGNKVALVTAAERGRGRAALDTVIKDCDALMTDSKDVLLVSFYADCVPLYFFDPEHEAVALAHAGWKGTVAEIASATIEAMEKAYGTRRERLRAAIGPSIGSCCYEVDGPVIAQVQRLLGTLPAADTERESMLELREHGKARLGLKEINRQIMIKAGILPSRIELSKWCTGCKRDLFFSHRAEGGRTGRMASWIGIRER
jgi:YfiH family protein